MADPVREAARRLVDYVPVDGDSTCRVGAVRFMDLRAALAATDVATGGANGDKGEVALPSSRDDVVRYVAAVLAHDATLPVPPDSMIDEVWRLCAEARTLRTILPLAVRTWDRGQSFARLKDEYDRLRTLLHDADDAALPPASAGEVETALKAALLSLVASLRRNVPPALAVAVLADARDLPTNLAAERAASGKKGGA